MKCYNHPNTDAVAVCRSCGRALCRDCVTEVGLTCSCRDRCESVVAAMNEIVERAKSAYPKTSMFFYRNGILVVLFALAFIGFGMSFWSKGDSSELCYFLLIVGFIFAATGISFLLAARRFRQR